MDNVKRLSGYFVDFVFEGFDLFESHGGCAPCLGIIDHVLLVNVGFNEVR